MLNMSRMLALRVLLTLACLLISSALFYRGEEGPLVWMWFFLAIGIGLVIGQRWALLLAPLPFLLGVSLGRFVQGPQPPGHGIYQFYFELTMFFTIIMGLIGIGIGLGPHAWIKNISSRLGEAAPGERPRFSLKRFIAQLAAGTIGGYASGMLVLLVAAVIGGNVATDFDFAGGRGYEATGGIVLLIGVVVGASASVYYLGRRGKEPRSYLSTLAGGVLTALLAGGIIWIIPHVRFVHSIFLLTGITALGATIGYNVTSRTWRIAGPAVVVVMLLVGGSAYTLSQHIFPPTVQFTSAGDPGGGFMEWLSANGNRGTMAYTASSPPADLMVQDGPQSTRCVPGPATDAIPRFTVSGQYFKPHEAIRIEGMYTRADCVGFWLSGQARADAYGSFTVEIASDPSGPPPAHSTEVDGLTFILTLEGAIGEGDGFGVLAQGERGGQVEFTSVRLFCGPETLVPDYEATLGLAAPPYGDMGHFDHACAETSYTQHMGSPSGASVRFWYKHFTTEHPEGITIHTGTATVGQDTTISAWYNGSTQQGGIGDHLPASGETSAP